MTLLEQLNLPSPVTQIHTPLLEQKNIQLFIKRDELIHPVIQGNKWRKLKYNILDFQNDNQNKHSEAILSFGGAYSNHLHALAAIGKELDIQTIGVIRGQAPRKLNPCLQDMLNWGMQLKFVTRLEYKFKSTDTFINQLKREFNDFYLIPEGGNNTAGKKGCAELLSELDDDYDTICCEVGSGTMLSSLIENNSKAHTNFLGFAVMKNPQLDQDIMDSLKKDKTISSKWRINHDYHFGGFAKTTNELNHFIHNIKQQHSIQLEPVYSGKMLWGIFDLIEKNYFKSGCKILAIHGGGLQGLRGFSDFKIYN